MKTKKRPRKRFMKTVKGNEVDPEVPGRPKR